MKNTGKYIVALALVLGLSVGSSAFADVNVGSETYTQQGQSQGQTATSNSGGGSVSDSGNAAVSFEDSFNGSAPIRYLPVPTHVNVSTEGGAQIFGSPNYADRGPHFMSMLVLVKALNNIDLNEAAIDDEGDIEMVGQLINTVSVADQNKMKDQKVEFFLNKSGDITDQFPDFKTVSVVTLKSDDKKTINSATLAVKLRKYCEAVGGKKIVLVSEGTSKRLTSWGVGLGFSANYASVGSDADDSGSAGASGTGWSYGQAEYFSLPYLTAVIGY